MTLYDPSGQINTTSVSGSSYTGLHAADGSYNIVLNSSSSYVGLFHPCGAYNAVTVSDHSLGFYNPNGSVNVVSNGSGGYFLLWPWNGVTVAGPASTWNNSDKTAQVTLSNGNLTASSTGVGVGGVRSTISKNSGKLYMEFTTGATYTNGGVGIATSAAILTGGANSLDSNATNAFVVFPSGNVWYNGSLAFPSTNIGSIGTGILIGMAVDFTNKTAWLRQGVGNWNGSGTANPATNIGGIDVSALFPTNPAFAVFDAGGSGTASVIANFGASSFTNSPPAGFSSWG